MMRKALAAAFALALAGCSANPEPATPALWQMSCPSGGTGWLMGTIHALERPADWRSETLDKAMAQADLLMVELADLDDAEASAEVWSKLAESSGHGPLSARVTPQRQGDLALVLKRVGLADSQFARTETWAAALTIAQAATPQLDSANGIDRAVLAAMRGKKVEELEGREGQLAIFDRLPEAEQRDLLDAVVADAATGQDESKAIAAAWRNGDTNAIARQTETGLLADPELREALFTARNRRWSERVLAAMARDSRPLVAVGAAHLAGPQGLPALLREQGCTVARSQ